MRDGSNDGMQHFDSEIENLIRSGVVDLEVGLTYATNPGNLRLELTDFLEERMYSQKRRVSSTDPDATTEVEIIR